MELFRNRPLCLAAFFAIVASLAGYYTLRSLTPLVLILFSVFGALACLAAFVLLLKKRPHKAYIPLLLLVLVAMALVRSYTYFPLKDRRMEEMLGQEREVCVRILDKEYARSDYASYVVEWRESEGTVWLGKALLACAYNDDFAIGAVLRLPVTVEDIRTSASVYDAAGYLADDVRWVMTSVTGADYETVSPYEPGFILRLRAWNRALSDVLRRDLNSETGSLASAMLLGNRHLLGDRVLRDFRRAGVSHVLALSGLHLTILAAAVETLLKRLRVTRGARMATLAVLVMAFVALTGFGASTARAALMLLLVYLARLFGVRGDTVTSLMLAVCLILLIFPPAVLDLGLWMSFLAVFGMVVGSEIQENRRRNRERSGKRQSKGVMARAVRYVGQTLWNTAACVFALIGISCFAFGELSWMAFLSNLAVIPLSTVFLILCLICLLMGAVGITVAPLIRLVEGVACLILRIVSRLAIPVGGVVSLKYGFAKVLVILFAVVMLVLLMVRVRRKWLIAYVPLVFTVAFVIGFCVHRHVHGDEMTLSYLQYKSSETLVISHGGRVLLCDMSDGSYQNMYEAAREAGRGYHTEIAAVILTHYHERHTDSLKKLCSRQMVRELWLPLPSTPKEAGVLASLVAMAYECDVTVRTYGYGQALSIGDGGSIGVTAEYLKRSTHPTLSVQIVHDEDSFFYVGASVGERGSFGDLQGGISQSRHVLFGRHGPVSKSVYRPAEGTAIAESIFFATSDLMGYTDLTDADWQACLRESTVIVNGTYHTYVIGGE